MIYDLRFTIGRLADFTAGGIVVKVSRQLTQFTLPNLFSSILFSLDLFFPL